MIISPYAEELIAQFDTALARVSGAEQLAIQRQMTDLFLGGAGTYSPRQIAIFDGVMGRLIERSDRRGLLEFTGRLAMVDTAPALVMGRLSMNDDIAVAGPVLEKSNALTDETLVAVARSKSQDHLFAIAQRLRLSERVTDVLVERGNRKVIHKVAANTGARFSLAGYDKLTHRARRDRKLTLALARRRDLPRQYFLKLLETASASVRAKLEAAHPEAAAAIRDTIDEVATGLQQEVRNTSQRFANALRDANRSFNAQPFTEANVHAPAHAQEFTRTVIALAKLGRFPVDVVERALIDKGEDMILILARAVGCSWITVKELLLMYVAERNLQPDELTRTFDRYTKLTQEAARQIVDFYGQRVKVRGKDARDSETTAGP